MNNNLIITEEDIFLFGMYPDSLNREKKKYITDNYEQFKEALDHYNSFTIPLTETETNMLNENIGEKIIHKKPEGIVLTQTWIPQSNQAEGLRLAAASFTLEGKVDSKSFSDKESQYLVRVVKSEESTLLYLFPQNKITQKYKIQILPSGSNYILIDTASPIEILDEEKIDQIVITVEQ